MTTNTTEQKWIFFYDTDHILNEVSNFTATLASRPNKDGAIRDHIIMTEDNDDMFLRLIKDAMSDIRSACFRWIEPEHPSDDMRRVDRIHIHTKMKIKEAEEVPAIVRALDDKMREYLIVRILFGWLMLKAPEEAEYYGNKAQELLAFIKKSFNSGDGVTRRPYILY